jgi:uncharacterized protein (TIGR03083 family)
VVVGWWACEDDRMVPDLLVALDLAAEAFGGRLAEVGDEDWTAATPCPGWDVHYLVAHVVGGNRFAVMVLDGATAADAVEAVMGTTQLGADPIGDFVTSSDAQRLRFRRSAALDQVVSHPLGGPRGRDRRRRGTRRPARRRRPPCHRRGGAGDGLRHRALW